MQPNAGWPSSLTAGFSASFQVGKWEVRGQCGMEDCMDFEQIRGFQSLESVTGLAARHIKTGKTYEVYRSVATVLGKPALWFSPKSSGVRSGYKFADSVFKLYEFERLEQGPQHDWVRGEDEILFHCNRCGVLQQVGGLRGVCRGYRV
jgi:hypothetical protein